MTNRRAATLGLMATFGLLATLAVPMMIALTSASAEAARRDRNRENLNRAEAYCRTTIRPSGVQCTARQCPCGIGRRRVYQAHQSRSRSFCACVPRNQRGRARTVFRAEAERYCANYNRAHPRANHHCVATTKCRVRNRLRRGGVDVRARMKVFPCKRPGRITRDP